MKKTKFITLKVALIETDISRTVVVPDNLTLSDLSNVIMTMFGWLGGHLWEYEMGREVVYAEPSEYDEDFSRFSKRVDSRKVTLSKAFPVRGSKMTYTYDFGDCWDHVITRMADPKEDGIVCKKTSGTFGIDDIGGGWRLSEFTKNLKKYDANPKGRFSREFREILEWSGFDDEGARKEFLECPTCEELTDMLRGCIGRE